MDSWAAHFLFCCISLTPVGESPLRLRAHAIKIAPSPRVLNDLPSFKLTALITSAKFYSALNIAYVWELEYGHLTIF